MAAASVDWPGREEALADAIGFSSKGNAAWLFVSSKG